MSSSECFEQDCKIETTCIHQNFLKDAKQDMHMVFNPVYRGSTVVFENYQEFIESAKTKIEKPEDILPFPKYGRMGNPTIYELSNTISYLENGDFTVITSGGMSAVTTSILAFLSSGDHAIIFDGIYTSTHSFASGIFPKLNISYDVCDDFIEGDLESKIKPNTKIIFFESCASGTFEIADIEKIAKIAKKHNIITICDNTMMTPMLLKPIDFGIDVIVHSLSKFAMGHADAMLGSITTTKEHFKILNDYVTLIGNHANSDVAYLTLRGIKTMKLRVSDAVERAKKVMDFLKSHKLVKEVLHPYTFTDKRKQNVDKYCKNGVVGLFGVSLHKKYTDEEFAKFFDNLKFFKLGFSWGGFESLCIKYSLAYRTGKAKDYDQNSYLRIYIGMENTDDLIQDLEESFSKLD